MLMNGNLSVIDIFTIVSVVLQLTNDDMTKSSIKDNDENFKTIIENQNLILEKLAKLG